MRRNAKSGSCSRCWQIVAADEGQLEQRSGRWTVTHDGDCPPYPGGYTGPTWVIDDGEPGSPDREPGPLWTIGEVQRAEVSSHEHRVPDDAPGRRPDPRGGRISLIVTVLAEAEPQFFWDADGDNPSALIGEDGWWSRARVRPATPEEAAPILAEEATLVRRRYLERRRQKLFAFGARRLLAVSVAGPDGSADVEIPEQPDLGFAVEVPFGAQYQGQPVDQLLVDEYARIVWTLTYNGGDGNDWTRNNHGSYIARRQPLTAQRAELIRELRAEYDLETWRSQLQIEPAAAQALMAAGWDYSRANRDLRAFALRDVSDVEVVLARTSQAWSDAGWITPYSHWGGHGVPPADAARLADAGVRYSALLELREAGHTTLEQQLAAAPPPVPTEPGRIILRAPSSAALTHGAQITTDPDLARRWLSTHPAYWWSGAVEHVAGVRPVHVVPTTDGRARGWSLWDDGELVRGADWLTLRWWPGRDSEAAPAPAGLSAAAAHAVGLIATCHNPVVAEVWRPLREAVAHTEITLAGAEHPQGSWTTAKSLVRHDYRLVDDSVRSLWQMCSSEGGMVGGDGDYDERHTIWPDEPAARAAYTWHALT